MTPTILLVDGTEAVRTENAAILRAEGYEVLEASDGMQAWERAIQGRPDLVLSEIVLARLDGFGLLTRFQKEPEFEGLPVVILTARLERADMRRAMEMGACDYLQKPCSREELVGALRAALKRQEAAAAAYEQRMQQMSESIEQESSVLDLDVRRVQDDRTEGSGGDFFASIQVIARLVELSEKFYQTSHSKSVALICRFLAGELGLSEQDTSTLVIAALLHDIGKAGMSERLLAADPERMAAIDFDVHAQHVRRGVDILQGMDSLRKVRRIIEEHHENHDGSGYPAGIAGGRICLEAQVLSIASIYHDKVYRLLDSARQTAIGPGSVPHSAQRHAHLHRLAIHHLRQKAAWFRPDVLDAFLGLARKGTCPVVGIGD